MTKRIKMMLYGGAGVGKSVFALHFPKPFFITTDGNYEWLEEFGAKEENHKQVTSWREFLDFVRGNNFEKYETIVVDLLEDLFSWCEEEYCRKNKIEHIGDQGYGKGYKITRDDFYVIFSKLIALPKNIVLLAHETSQTVKDKRGVESTLYFPSKIIPESLRDRIEGNLRYVLRAKFEDEVYEDKVVQRRVLSLAGDSNEFSIIRGVNMNEIPDKIDLDYNEFLKTLKLDNLDFKNVNTQLNNIKPKKEEVEINEKNVILEKIKQVNSDNIIAKNVQIEEIKTNEKLDENNELIVEIPQEKKEVKSNSFTKEDILKQIQKLNLKKEENKPEIEEEKIKTKDSIVENDIIAQIKAKIKAIN